MKKPTKTTRKLTTSDHGPGVSARRGVTNIITPKGKSSTRRSELGIYEDTISGKGPGGRPKRR